MAAAQDQYGAIGDNSVAREEGVYTVFQDPLDSKDLPPEIRTGFIKKTYGLLSYMLLISFGIASVFVFSDPMWSATFLKQNMWLMYAAVGVVACFVLFNMVVVFTTCCGGETCLNMYIKLFKVFPVNLIFMTVFSAAFGLLIGLICTLYTVQSVCWVFALSAAIIIGLTVYAVTTKTDFTGFGMYFIVALIALIFTGILAAAIGGPVMHKVYGGLGAMIFGFIIVYDTQLIFGVWNKKERQLQYTVDMYGFAAFNLYMDFIQFFLYMLELFGESR